MNPDLLNGDNAYVETLYDAWMEDHASVPEAWAKYFSELGQQAAEADSGQHTHALVQARMQRSWRQGEQTSSAPTGADKWTHQDVEYPSRVLYLIQAYRMHGHLHADLDPLKLNSLRSSPDLELGYYGLKESDLDTLFPTWDLAGPAQMKLRDILDTLKQTYCGHIGPELMHVSDTAQRRWLQQRLESIHSKPSFGKRMRQWFFSRLMRAEEFEHFLHTRYAGQKRFSLEGGESLIPMLNLLMHEATVHGVEEVILGMAHRGRLNVLANVMGKDLSEIFAEFEGNFHASPAQGAGDVKYHMGYSSDITTEHGTLHLSLAFNPSHLEIITPVLLGSVRARQCRRGDSARREVMGVLIHGDAAFAGQGVVAESLNLGGLPGYRTGGTIHIVVNNQIGFTTNTFDARSTLYCTDIAKMVQAPILHVNGDDPDACCLAMQVAMEYKHRFRKDIVIDLVCYRRHGHNEADSPEVTQPLMYRRINEHPTLLSLYRQRMLDEGVMTAEEIEADESKYKTCIDRIRRESSERAPAPPNSLHGRWDGFSREAEEPKTAVSAALLQQLAPLAHQVPEDFALHPKIRKLFDGRIAMMQGDAPVDWGCAEIMAYATLVNQGGWVRLSGQDSGRGTFFHRHAIVYDQNTGKSILPLEQVRNGPLSHVIVVDSMLSETAVMAFEYGYSVAEPRALVIWEAQYGDFANNAQVVIDQFIAAGESKWHRMSGLVLWLPHGQEGQGAEHSSARLERFLELGAENNIWVTYPTTPAQLFHLLRRQFRIASRKPLVIMGPKSLLRNKLSFSSLDEFTEGHFQPVLAENETSIQDADVRRLILCSGKVYYDLLAARNEQKLTDIAIVRIERLYPFPYEELQQQTHRYVAAKEVVWAQEEPLNQGAWFQVKHHLKRCLLDIQKLNHLTRSALAAPAAGSSKRHAEEQQALVKAALAEGDFGSRPEDFPNLAINEHL